jgi:hypothetical protein
VFSSKEPLYHIRHNQKLIVQLGEHSIDLSSFCTSTTHKSETCPVEFGGDFSGYLGVDLVGQYWLDWQSQRVADKAFHGRIAGQVGGWLYAAC